MVDRHKIFAVNFQRLEKKKKKALNQTLFHFIPVHFVQNFQMWELFELLFGAHIVFSRHLAYFLINLSPVETKMIIYLLIFGI